MFPESDAARGAKGGKPSQRSADQVAFQQPMRGIRFWRAVEELGRGCVCSERQARCSRRSAAVRGARHEGLRPVPARGGVQDSGGASIRTNVVLREVKYETALPI
ncbi:MAG: hypothetical protein ACK5PW_03195 [Burkholderiales bacterium]|jgi:hypothetical protein